MDEHASSLCVLCVWVEVINWALIPWTLGGSLRSTHSSYRQALINERQSHEMQSDGLVGGYLVISHGPAAPWRIARKSGHGGQLAV
jgi:hypothetical protein